jgi:hypothetical protein
MPHKTIFFNYYLIPMFKQGTFHIKVHVCSDKTKPEYTVGGGGEGSEFVWGKKREQYLRSNIKFHKVAEMSVAGDNVQLSVLMISLGRINLSVIMKFDR